jgi:hypothetical protein
MQQLQLCLKVSFFSLHPYNLFLKAHLHVKSQISDFCSNFDQILQGDAYTYIYLLLTSSAGLRTASVGLRTSSVGPTEVIELDD